MSVRGMRARRRGAAPPPPPMAVPLDPHAGVPLGVRIAEWAQGIVTRRLSRATRRVLSWTFVALCTGVVAVAYLFQTSHVAGLANIRGQLESTTVAVQDQNARLMARAAEARALGRAEPAARSQGLRVAGAGNVAYLTVADVPDPTATPTAAPTATPGTVARVRATLLGQASVDAPNPQPIGTTATAEATQRPASLGNVPRPGTAAPVASITPTASPVPYVTFVTPAAYAATPTTGGRR